MNFRKNVLKKVGEMMKKVASLLAHFSRVFWGAEMHKREKV